MKVAHLVYLLSAGLALSLGLVGCSKNPQRTTNIPGRNVGPITGDTPSRPVQPVSNTTPITTGDPGRGDNNPPVIGTTISTDPNGTGGLLATSKNFDDWIPNRDEFKDQTVYFEFDKSTVNPGEISKLEEVVRRMKGFPGKALRVEGHCDERGTEEYNRSLGDRRALSIREKLVQLGLDATMIPTITFGEEKPVDPGHTDAAWSKNRRGELILLSPPGSN